MKQFEQISPSVNDVYLQAIKYSIALNFFLKRLDVILVLSVLQQPCHPSMQRSDIFQFPLFSCLVILTQTVHTVFMKNSSNLCDTLLTIKRISQPGMVSPCNVWICLHASVDKTLLCVLPVCSMYHCAAGFGCCEARSLPSDWILAGIST